MRNVRSVPLVLTLVLTMAAMTVAGGCTSVGASRDKAGGPGDPVVLRMGSATGDLRLHPSVDYFVHRVGELSSGDIRIEVIGEWGEFAPDAEQLVVRSVAAGEIDLGWVGSRVFDTLGVHSFQALTAPMLIDTYGLENAVIESGITEQMMQALDDVGVVGLGVLPDGLRKPIGVASPILTPADWAGTHFGTLKSNGQSEAIQALRAMPIEVDGTYRDEAVANGSIDGFELSLAAYNTPLQNLARYVSLNVNLWPLMDVVFANPERLEGLSGARRAWLEQAADDAAGRAAAFVARDDEVIEIACATGARLFTASAQDLTGLRDAVASVYIDLRGVPSTAVFIEQIHALKRSTPADPSPVIPPGCSGAPHPAVATSAAETAPANLEGTYRYEITLDEAREADMVDPEDTYPQAITVTMDDARFSMNDGNLTGTYAVDGERITYNIAEFGYGLTFTFSVDVAGNLDLRPVQPMDPGDAFVFSSNVWTKIE